MLRDFKFCFRGARGADELGAQLVDVAVAAQSAESVARFEQRGADPEKWSRKSEQRYKWKLWV